MQSSQWTESKTSSSESRFYKSFPPAHDTAPRQYTHPVRPYNLSRILRAAGVPLICLQSENIAKDSLKVCQDIHPAGGTERVHSVPLSLTEGEREQLLLFAIQILT